MADKLLTESAWSAFAKKRELDDSALLKALGKLEKADDARPDDWLKALDEAETQIKKVIVSNPKRKDAKDTKEVKDKLYELMDAVERQRKEAEHAKDAEEAAASDEEDSPALLTTKMVPLLRALRKGEVQMHALVATAGKNTAVLIMRRAIAPARRKLLAEAVDAKGGVKYIVGECLLENQVLTFVVQSPAAGLAKRIREALLLQTELRLKVRVRGEDGAEDLDGQDDADDAADEPEADAATTATATPTPTAPTTAPDAPRAPTAEALAYAQRLHKLRDALVAALQGKHPEATKLRALMAFAKEKAEAEPSDYPAALKSLEMLEKLLGTAGGAPAGAASGAASAAASPGSATPTTSIVNLQKARLAWLQTRQAVQGELKRLEQSILADFAGEPDFADVQRDVRRLDQVMRMLDEELADMLDAAVNAEGEERSRLQDEAREQVEAYGDYVATDGFVADLDLNPYTPLKIRDTVTRSLAVLRKALA